MTNYIPTENIHRIAIIECDFAICRECGVKKTIRGIFTHHFRSHTEEGRKHTERVKYALVDHNRNSKDTSQCDSCGRTVKSIHRSIHKKSCDSQKKFLESVIGSSCKACGHAIKSLYGSGRFCSPSCAKGKSARPNTVAKNKKISESLSGRAATNPDGTPKVSIHNCLCQVCRKPFISKHRPRKFCSIVCHNKSPEYRVRMQESTLRRIERGAQYPRGIKCNFNFRDKKIRCDSKHEWICLSWLVASYDILEIERCGLKLEYELNGLNRTYNPDFSVLASTGDRILVEAKMEQASGSNTFSKYTEEARIKKDILRSYCDSQGYQMMWFTQDTDRKSYRAISKTFKKT